MFVTLPARPSEFYDDCMAVFESFAIIKPAERYLLIMWPENTSSLLKPDLLTEQLLHVKRAIDCGDYFLRQQYPFSNYYGVVARRDVEDSARV